MKPLEPSLELPRLSASGDSTLVAAVAELRARTPDASELAGLASRLALQGIGVTTTPRPPAPSGAWKKWALSAGALAGVGVWLSLATPQVAPPPPPPEAAHATHSASRLASVPPRPNASGFAVLAPDSPRPRREEPLAAPASGGSPTNGPSATTPAATAASHLGASDSAEQAPDRTANGTRTRTPATPPAGGSSNASQAPISVDVPTEIELLRDARLALKQSPSRALDLADAHARAFPRGKLTQERELIAISALVALGRRTAALSRADRFGQTFPESPYRKQIGELLR